MSPSLEAIVDVIQQDVGARGLRTDPAANLVTASTGGLEAASASIAQKAGAALAVVTGFYIPHATPPCGETDGPLGALFLARALMPLGVRVALVTDPFCAPALEAGLAACGLGEQVPLVTLPAPGPAWADYAQGAWTSFARDFGLTHLLALERVGPSHTPKSLQRQGASAEVVQTFLAEVSPDHWDRCHTMRGLDITERMGPAHRLFETATDLPRTTTIGIGDGANEIGMGKIPWEVLRRNVPGGGLVACRVAVDHLIVAGVSNWGAYGLAAGLYHLRGLHPPTDLFDPQRELGLLQVLVEQGPLVDGVTGRQTPTVDGLSWESYARPLRLLECAAR